MSLALVQGTEPLGLMVKTEAFGPNTVYLGDYQISMEDFAVMVFYVLTNSDLEPNDPRLELLKMIKSLDQVNGYNPGKKRLGISEK